MRRKKFFRYLRLNPVLHSIATVIFGFSLSLYLKLSCWPNKYTIHRKDILDKYVPRGGNLFVFWHSRLFFVIYYYCCIIKEPKISVLISRSRDGDYGQYLAKRLNQEVIRGSSSKGAHSAIRQIKQKLAEGKNIAITPDGPRGPALKVNDGTIKLAQLTGAPLIPASYDASRKKFLRSWDKLILVMPFGRINMEIGEPIYVPKDAKGPELEEYRLKLEKELHRLDKNCADRISSGKSKQPL